MPILQLFRRRARRKAQDSETGTTDVVRYIVQRLDEGADDAVLVTELVRDYGMSMSDALDVVAKVIADPALRDRVAGRVDTASCTVRSSLDEFVTVEQSDVTGDIRLTIHLDRTQAIDRQGAISLFQDAGALSCEAGDNTVTGTFSSDNIAGMDLVEDSLRVYQRVLGKRQGRRTSSIPLFGQVFPEETIADYVHRRLDEGLNEDRSALIPEVMEHYGLGFSEAFDTVSQILQELPEQ